MVGVVLLNQTFLGLSLTPFKNVSLNTSQLICCIFWKETDFNCDD